MLALLRCVFLTLFVLLFSSQRGPDLQHHHWPAHITHLLPEHHYTTQHHTRPIVRERLPNNPLPPSPLLYYDDYFSSLQPRKKKHHASAKLSQQQNSPQLVQQDILETSWKQGQRKQLPFRL